MRATNDRTTKKKPRLTAGGYVNDGRRRRWCNDDRPTVCRVCKQPIAKGEVMALSLKTQPAHLRCWEPSDDAEDD